MSASVCGVVLVGWMVGRHWSLLLPQAARGSNTAALVTAPDRVTTMGDLVALLEETLRTSRPVLLGSRDPRGPSCVNVVRRGDIQNDPPEMEGDVDGGPGMRLVTLYTVAREGIASPVQDYRWHQTRLRTLLDNELVINRAAMELAHRLSERARQFAAAADNWTSFPAELQPEGYNHNGNWPGYCLTELDRAIAARDLNATRHWAGEFASATFSLDDLHHWLELLAQNHLRALDFQRRCESLFVSAQSKLAQYDPDSTICIFPAGILSLNCTGNYFEVERQAERLYSMPPDRLQEIALNKHLTSGSLWVFPGLRECYLKLRGALSSENQATWDQAARSSYEHSYLNCMLFRASRADASDYLCAVLKRFDAAHPHATVGELMSVLMYRGHSFGGLEWADRFQPELLDAASAIPTSADDLEAIKAAWRWTSKFYRGPAEGYGMSLTLRDALQRKKLDCVRATDMIGAIFRNSGRPRFGHVRWCAENNGHSVAAIFANRDGRRETLLLDGLQPGAEPELWPDCYFHGHAWPAGISPTPTPYAAELYLRGLDNYLWGEGYIIRGPNAGVLMTAAIPHSTNRREAREEKVFAGPYPN